LLAILSEPFVRFAMNAPNTTTTVSVYFDSHRSYVTLVQYDAANQLGRGFQLDYVNATHEPVNLFDDTETLRASAGMQELEQILGGIAGRADSMRVSIDMDSVLSYQMPLGRELSAAQMREFIRFELHQHAPDSNPDEFSAALHPIESASLSPSALAVFVHPTALETAQHLASVAGVLPANLRCVGGAQIDAHNAHAFNYPEDSAKFVAICGVQSDFVDVSILKHGRIHSASTLTLTAPLVNPTELGEVCWSEIERFQKASRSAVEAVYFFGTDLTKSALTEASAMFPMPTQRLNPLRRLVTTLSQREREYCSRIAHVLAPCIGAVLPEMMPRIQL
jgi:hypothetical protein